MELKLFFLLLCTSLVAISTTASSITCDDLVLSEQAINQTSIQLQDIESNVTKASDDGTPLPQDLSGPYTSDRHAAQQKLISALQRLQSTVRTLDDQGSGKHSASLEKLEEGLQSFQAKLSSQNVDQGVPPDASTQPSEQGTMDLAKLLRTVRAMQKLSHSVNQALAAAIKKKCASGSLEARQDLSTLLEDLSTLLTDLLDDVNGLLDAFGTLLTALLENVSPLLSGVVARLIGLLEEVISAVSQLISEVLSV